MTYVDQDGDPSTTNSSVTNLTLDPSAEVVFAGLYWSGDVPAKTGDATLGSARLTDPTGVQTDVVAERVDHATASTRDVYQAFADVTDQVSQGGAGKWTFGGAALATGAAHYGGWTLVVVYGDSTLPVGKVTVFEGFQSVNPGGDLAFNVAGTAGQAARIGLVAWEGDAGISGDRMTLDGATLTPTDGRARRQQRRRLDRDRCDGRQLLRCRREAADGRDVRLLHRQGRRLDRHRRLSDRRRHRLPRQLTPPPPSG